MYSPKNTVLQQQQQQQLNKSSHPCGLMSMLSSLYAYITREYSPQALPRNTAPAPLTVQFTKAKTPSSVADCLRWAAIAYDCPTTERVQSCCNQFPNQECVQHRVIARYPKRDGLIPFGSRAELHRVLARKRYVHRNLS